MERKLYIHLNICLDLGQAIHLFVLIAIDLSIQLINCAGNTSLVLEFCNTASGGQELRNITVTAVEIVTPYEMYP